MTGAIVVDHSVLLARFPDGIQVPPEYSDRLRFDTAAHRLVYRGFMSKADFDRLGQLCDDWPYRRAMEELFRLCTEDPPPRAHGLRGLFGRWRG